MAQRCSKESGNVKGNGTGASVAGSAAKCGLRLFLTTAIEPEEWHNRLPWVSKHEGLGSTPVPGCGARRARRARMCLLSRSLHSYGRSDCAGIVNAFVRQGRSGSRRTRVRLGERTSRPVARFSRASDG